MPKPKSKELPYLSDMLQLIHNEFKKQKKRQKLCLEWSNKWNITNSVMNIIVHDYVEDSIKEWWEDSKKNISKDFPNNKYCGYCPSVGSKLFNGKIFLDSRI